MQLQGKWKVIVCIVDAIQGRVLKFMPIIDEVGHVLGLKLEHGIIVEMFRAHLVSLCVRNDTYDMP